VRARGGRLAPQDGRSALKIQTDTRDGDWAVARAGLRLPPTPPAVSHPLFLSPGAARTDAPGGGVSGASLRAVRRQLVLSSPGTAAVSTPSDGDTDGEGEREHDDHLGAFDPPPLPPPPPPAAAASWAWSAKPPRPPHRTPTSVLDVRMGSLSSLTPLTDGGASAYGSATPAGAAFEEVPLSAARAIVHSVRPKLQRGCALFASCAKQSPPLIAAASPPHGLASPDGPHSAPGRSAAPARRSRLCSILG